MTLRYNSIKFKISILYTFILGVILIIYSSFLYVSLHISLYYDVDLELNKKVEIIRQTLNDYLDVLSDDPNAFSLALKKTIRLDRFYTKLTKITELDRKWLMQIDKLNFRDDYINIFDSNNKKIITSKNMPPKFLITLSNKTKGLENKENPFKKIKYQKRKFRIISSSLIDNNNKTYYIQICTSLKPVINILENRQLAIFISIPIILIFTSFLGRVFTKKLLKPLIEITNTAKKITHHDLTSRIKSENVEEEMSYLVQAFNEMISRLDTSFKYVAEFSSNVAHELKTPLAIIRGECELALRKERTKEEYQRVINVNLEEFERMLKTIDDLLLLTKLDYRPDFFNLEKINLSNIISEIYEQCKILASQKNIEVNLKLNEQDIYINGNRIHIRRLFYNLIQNAIRFNKENGQIFIKLRTNEAMGIIEIEDTGTGIPTSELEKIFKKFYHSQKNNEDKDPGNGLGLSIAESIAKIHNGEISVNSVLGKGSTFYVKIPVIL